MANPTSAFGWQMPTSTDLVTDLPADFETFGQAVDTSLADLKGGTTGQVLSKASNTDMDFTWVAQDDSNAIQNAIVDAKGDLIAATAADTPARLPVGTNGQVLTADSTEATGLKWAAAASGGLTLLATATPSAASSFSFTSISGSYTHLLLVWRNFFTGSTGVYATMKLNNDSGSNYSADLLKINGTTGATVSADLTSGFSSMMGPNANDQVFPPGSIINNGSSQVYGRGSMIIYNYTNTTMTNYEFEGRAYDQANVKYNYVIGNGSYSGGGAITRIDVTTSSSTFSGTCYLYGVK